MKVRKQNDYIKELVGGQRALYDLPDVLDEEIKAKLRLEAVSRLVNRPELVDQVKKNGVVKAAAGRNAEQMIGEVTVPLSVVGPLQIKDEFKCWVPLATTEGALVASVQRGVRTLGLAGGAACMVEDRGITRAPVFAAKGAEEGRKLVAWLRKNERFMKQMAETTSRHLKLVKVETEQVGKNLWVRFRYLTGEAMGMNMVTIATQTLVEWIEKEMEIKCVALSGNLCVDKKASWSNVILGRGLKIQAEVVIPKEIVELKLKTTPREIVGVVTRKDWMGSVVSGSMGFNGHFANMVAAVYLATGQDMAHVVEGALGIVTAELDGKDLYFSVNLPNVILGTVGGGTHLPVQNAALTIMGLGAGMRGEKTKLGKILGATVLAGELSLTAALAEGQLARAHQRLGRAQP